MAAVSEPICHGCLEDREKVSLSPRQLVMLPATVTAHDFKKKDIPVFLCEYCDSDELEMAIKLHWTKE